MKALAALLGVLVAAGIAAFLIPRYGHAPAPTQPRSFDDARIDARRPEKPIEAPLSRQEEIRQEFSEKRMPFYRRLRERYPDLIQHFGVTDSLDTLDLVVSKADDQTIQSILADAIGPDARQYGFRKVRFYVANPPGSIDPLNLVAESSHDDAGRWNTFRK